MKAVLQGRIARSHPYTLDKTLSVEDAAADSATVGLAIQKTEQTQKEHSENIENPHNVTKSQVGLGNVDNTSDEDKPVSIAQQQEFQRVEKIGTDAQATADNAQTSADNAQTAADNAKTAADNAQATADDAKTAAENALTDSKAYTDGKHLSLTAKLYLDWTGDSAPYKNVVAVDGITKEDNPHIMPVYSSNLETALQEMEAWSMVCDADANDGSITFTCFEDKPEVIITVQIEVNR